MEERRFTPHASPKVNFTQTSLPCVGKPVLRLGVAGNFGLASADIEYAAERGINYWLWSPRVKNMTEPLRGLLQRDREAHVVSVLAVAYTAGMVKRAVEKARRQLNVDALDCVKLAWLGRMAFFTQRIQDTLLELKEQRKVLSLGVSIHDRPRAAKLAQDSILDTLMVRYNAKHPGAERDIFPHLRRRNPTIISYTATSWRQLIRPIAGLKMSPWPSSEEVGAVPPLTPALCYRFCLSHPQVHVTMSGPANRQQLDENLAALSAGPLTEEEMAWVREYGKKVKVLRRIPYV